MSSILVDQYKWVQSSRGDLFNYCASISVEDFTRSSPNFGKGGSMRNMFVHICNTYQGWLGRYLPSETIIEIEYVTIPTLKECRDYFEITDELVSSFLKKYENDPYKILNVQEENRVFESNPLHLFTRTITHEFHHKGQILSLSRLWGYTPFGMDN